MHRTLDARSERFALATPFRIARGAKTVAEVVTVTIGEGGMTGRGEAVPYPRYGETIADTLAAIEGARIAIEAGEGRDALAQAMPAGAARNAIDCALWDLEARLARTSVAAILGRAEPAAVPSALTIGLDTPEAMADVARRVATVPLLKVKVNRDARAQIAAVRAVAPAPRMIVDPNESWTMAEVTELQKFLADMRIDLLEQPLPAGEDAALEGYASAVPICADESLHVAADLDRLAGRYAYVNVKLDKTGGLTEAVRLADAARARGFGLMVGCMVCSSLGIAPALQIAGDAAFVDLDGPLWLTADRPGGVTDRDGMLSPPASGFWGDASDFVAGTAQSHDG